MPEGKHTPPPWRFDPYSDNIYGSGITVARDVMVEADAVLIINSPDLLKFVEQVADIMGDSPMAKRARELVAKARGGT